MLTSLHINNYALIERLNVNFEGGFSAITGETGAGKSILLGALGFVLGDRADSNVLYDKQKKCIVEAEFTINENLRELFESHDLDFDNNCTIRRELSPQKKTRAFINDSIVTLQTLNEIGSYIVDIHSQHDTLLLTNNDFRIDIIDSIANNNALLVDYKDNHLEYNSLQHKLNELRDASQRNIAENDYLKFQLNELINANISEGEYEENERNLHILENSEEINNHIVTATSALENAEPSILTLINDVENSLTRLSRILNEASTLAERTTAVKIELKDIAYELDKLHGNYDFDEAKLAALQERQDTLGRLLVKHKLNSTDDLIRLVHDLRKRIDAFENIDKDISETEKRLVEVESALRSKADKLHRSRIAAAAKLSDDVCNTIKQLSMPHAVLNINVETVGAYKHNGNDEIKILFSANKGIEPAEVQHIASGGELSRLMLAIKSAIAGYAYMPTLVFDEIDTGVSGEVAAKIGNIMVKMGTDRQIIAITHLPQVASKAANQYLIYKDNIGEKTKSNIKLLNKTERINEIAKMLSSDMMTDEAIHAAEAMLK